MCITPGAGYVESWAAIIYGVLAGAAYKGASWLCAHPRVRIDDPVDAIAVHGACGMEDELPHSQASHAPKAFWDCF